MYDATSLEATMKAVLPGSTRINISINEDQRAGLEKLSKKTGAPLAEVVRRAIDLYLKKEA
jgi:predicted DNA-binding protein